MIYNPLDEEITRTIEVPVYYTGLSSKAIVHEQEEEPIVFDIARDYTIRLTVSLPANGYNYFILK